MTRAEIVLAARGWIGTPYRHQASLKGVGCDCLGLLRGVWREVIGPEPESAPPYRVDWALDGRGEALREAAARHLLPAARDVVLPGNVLLFRWRERLPATHCGIATAPDSMVHAHDGAALAEVAITPWWRRHLCEIFAFPGLSP